MSTNGDSPGYGVILADPPWDYQNFGARKHGSPKTHYHLTESVDIAKVPVSKWAAKDCILLLWATWPKLNEALEVMEAWGFDYITGIPWIKVSPSSGNIRTGIGFWTQSTSEMVLIGRRGEGQRPKRLWSP